MAQDTDIPVIYEKVRKGNAWSLQFRLLDDNKVPVVLAAETLVRMHVRVARGVANPVLFDFTSADGTITYDAQGLVTITGWTSAQTLAMTNKTMIGEVAIGPNNSLLKPYFVIVFQLLDAVTIPA